MLELCRTVRFCLTGDEAELDSPRDNTFSAWPAMRGLGRYYEIAVACQGEADAATGYFINITHIDRAVREHALPLMIRRLRDDPAGANIAMGSLMRDLYHAIGPRLDDTVVTVTLVLSPFLKMTIEKHDMDHVLFRQQYEFAAAHRLHVPALSDEQNREVFGKCNNPAGHGHNYRVEVAARCPIAEDGTSLDPTTLDAAVNTYAIDKLDHKHLNRDVPQFADLNPSVENIVRVVWSMLVGHMPEPAKLEEVKVWETGKTVCAYRGGYD